MNITEKTTEGPIGLGTKWREDFRVLWLRSEFVLSIVEYQENKQVAFEGTSLGPVEPRFAVTFEKANGGTRITYVVEPKVRGPFEPLVSLVGIQWGKGDLKRYLRRLKAVLESGN